MSLMKKFLIVFLLGFSLFTIAQENYNVIIMPKKFDFLKEENQFKSVIIADLGLCGFVEEPGDKETRVCGTPGFVAPEILNR